MEKNNGHSFDKNIQLALKMALALMVVSTVLALTKVVSGQVAQISLMLGLLAGTVLMLIKAAYTGKRYAQGAKGRRSRLFPFIFNSNETLEDDVVKMCNGK